MRDCLVDEFPNRSRGPRIESDHMVGHATSSMTLLDDNSNDQSRRRSAYCVAPLPRSPPRARSLCEQGVAVRFTPTRVGTTSSPRSSTPPAPPLPVHPHAYGRRRRRWRRRLSVTNLGGRTVRAAVLPWHDVRLAGESVPRIRPRRNARCARAQRRRPGVRVQSTCRRMRCRRAGSSRAPSPRNPIPSRAADSAPLRACDG